MAAHFCTVGPTHLTGRVYGIMQVFDLKLGKSALSSPQGSQFNLQKLENHLGAALLVGNHTSPAAPGQAGE